MELWRVWDARAGAEHGGSSEYVKRVVTVIPLQGPVVIDRHDASTQQEDSVESMTLPHP